MPKSIEPIVAYFKEFESYSQYKVILSEENVPACLLTKNGDKPVGAIYQNKNSAGTLLLLPDIDFNADVFFDENEDGSLVWNEDASRFAARLVCSSVFIDKWFKSDSAVTLEPSWVKAYEYEMESEKAIRVRLLELEEKIEKLQITKENLLNDLKNSGRLRNLLFENGKPLEYAIIDGLTILGFNASQYKDAESEFDVVFESEEGRLIGEAEGKDNKPINVDKLRQLTMNIQEDLARDEVDSLAKGVLFGNAYRLLPLIERLTPFTDKCVRAAKSSSVALISTPDLFKVAQYLSGNADEEFAKCCRLAIVNAIGIVIFPDVPKSDTVAEIIVEVD
ncbi:MAG: hypothetical protein WCI11_18685 [Candidatus Methylumidiphilus sp.]